VTVTSPHQTGRPLLGVAGGILGLFSGMLSLAVNYVVGFAAAFNASSAAAVGFVVIMIGELATTGTSARLDDLCWNRPSSRREQR
jgi:hypothetical protein